MNDKNKCNVLLHRVYLDTCLTKLILNKKLVMVKINFKVT